MDDRTDPAAAPGGLDEAVPAPRLVRPYVLTRGRTKAAGTALPLEALVRAVGSADSLDPDVAPEARRILALCTAPTAIAELAARLELPIGVVRVLVGDLTAAGALIVASATPADAATDVALLERLLDGIRAL